RTNEILMPPGERHFADILREQGYRLALFGKNHCFPPAEEARLFDERCVFAHQGPEPAQCQNDREREGVSWSRAPAPTPRSVGGRASVKPSRADDCPSAILARRVGDFLVERAADDRPFCAWVSIPDPHGPLQCPQPYASMHPPASIALPPWRADDLAGKMERA